MPNPTLVHRFSQTQWAALLVLEKEGGQSGEKAAIRKMVVKVPCKTRLKLQRFSPRSSHTAPVGECEETTMVFCTNEGQVGESLIACRVMSANTSPPVP